MARVNCLNFHLFVNVNVYEFVTKFNEMSSSVQRSVFAKKKM